MPVPSYSDSKKDLIEAMRETPGDGREFHVAKALIEIKTQETMNKATWALVFATFGLIVTSIVQILVSLNKC